MKLVISCLQHGKSCKRYAWRSRECKGSGKRLTYHAPKNLLRWPHPFLTMSTNMSQLMNSDLSETFHSRGHEYHNRGALIWTNLVNMVNTTSFEGSICNGEQLFPAGCCLILNGQIWVVSIFSTNSPPESK